jgi:hypothetical protein
VTQVDLDRVRRRCDRVLADAYAADDVLWLLREGRLLARQAGLLADEVAVLREVVDDLESRLVVVDAERLAAVAVADERRRDLSALRVALMTVEQFARKARAG